MPTQNVFGHNNIVIELIFKIFAAHFMTFGLLKDDMVIFSCAVPEK